MKKIICHYLVTVAAINSLMVAAFILNLAPDAYATNRPSPALVSRHNIFEDYAYSRVAAHFSESENESLSQRFNNGKISRYLWGKIKTDHYRLEAKPDTKKEQAILLSRLEREISNGE